MPVNEKPWVSFCMSTYKRPEFLKTQLEIISQQIFKDYEVIVSDNDSDMSAKNIVENFKDTKFKYYANGGNIGMMPSFNLSIERANAEYIVMITDDDPVEPNFLSELYKICQENTGYGVYAGFLRKKTNSSDIELIVSEKFAEEILNPSKTKKILWSSCIIKKEVAIQVGKIPEYGSPHLADHAFIVMAGSVQGGVVINKMFSTLSSHNSNFSKSNIPSYVLGCQGFYTILQKFFIGHTRYNPIKKSINKHLQKWFIIGIFTLKKYYSIKNDNIILSEINDCAKLILELNFMQFVKTKYRLKNLVFLVKRRLNLL